MLELLRKYKLILSGVALMTLAFPIGLFFNHTLGLAIIGTGGFLTIYGGAVELD